MDASNYDGPLTAAELAASKVRNGPSRRDIAWPETAGYAQDRAEATAASAAYWSACACGGLTQPMSAESATDEGSDFPKKAKRKRTLHWSIRVPLYCALLVTFLCAGWLLELIPSRDTARVLALAVGAPMALIILVALLVRWLH